MRSIPAFLLVPLKEGRGQADHSCMRRISTRATFGTAALISVVLAGGVVAAVTREGTSDQSASRMATLVETGGQPVAGDVAPAAIVPTTAAPMASTTTTTITTTTTARAAAGAVTAPFVAPVEQPPITSAATTIVTTPPTTATTVPPTTTTAAAAQTVSVTPSSGDRRTMIWVRGTGCVGTDTGGSLAIYDPSGVLTDGDGGGAQPDGSWQVPIYINRDPGVYKIQASCVHARSTTPLFVYAPAYFTVTA